MSLKKMKLVCWFITYVVYFHSMFRYKVSLLILLENGGWFKKKKFVYFNALKASCSTKNIDCVVRVFVVLQYERKEPYKKRRKTCGS